MSARGPIILRLSNFPAESHLQHFNLLTTYPFAFVTSPFASTKVWCESCRTDGDKHENDGDGAIYMPAKTSTSVLPQSSLSTANPPPRNTETSLLIGARNELSDISGNPRGQTGDAKRSSLLPQRHIRILLLIEALYSVGLRTVFYLLSGGRFCVPGVG